MINKICLNNFVIDGKWRPIGGGEGSGRVPDVWGCLVCAVALSLTVEVRPFGTLIDWIWLLIGSISPLDLVDFMTPLAVLSPSLLRCNPINSVWGEYQCSI